MRRRYRDQDAGFTDFQAAQPVHQAYVPHRKALQGCLGQLTHFVESHGLVGFIVQIEGAAPAGVIANDALKDHGRAVFTRLERICDWLRSDRLAYDRALLGLGLFGADLATMAANHRPNGKAGHESVNYELTGLADVEYLIAERKGSGAQLQNRAQITFKNQRRGLASWLAAPAPIGGLDFVSRDAGAAAAFISKSPSAMLDDILNIVNSAGGNATGNVEREESELKVRFHQDLADTLGGEVTFALDGPILPTPSWKLIVEVHDPNRLQSTIEQLITDMNSHVKGEHPGLAEDQETTNGQTFYTIRTLDATKPFEVTYTFTDGYMILGPSKAMVMNAIAIHQNGNSLVHSADFRALLPQDEHPDVSAVLYQNLAPVIGPIAPQLSPSQLQSLQQLAAETKPSVVCAYGEDNAIRVSTSSRLFGFDLNTLALSALMKVARPMQGHRLE